MMTDCQMRTKLNTHISTDIMCCGMKTQVQTLRHGTY